ncbi:NAD(P)/FAD-dependent oxidoreductase [Martelella sp. FLE1502]
MSDDIGGDGWNAGPASLRQSAEAHNAAVSAALALRGGFPEDWVVPRKGIDHDVVIVGGGQSGVAIALALKRAGITRISLIDAARSGEEGIWRTTARMKSLRSPKQLPGPELDVPEMSFRAWYAARNGDEAYDALQSIPRLVWAQYLDWFRTIAGVSVRYQTRLDRIESDENGLRLALSVDGEKRIETCRKVVLATGFLGGGFARIPDWIKNELPPERYAHADTMVDFTALKGRRLAVFGAASSAFDAAAVALEAGVHSVHMFCRQDDLERYSRMRVLYYPGSVEHFPRLPDRHRWHIMNALCCRAQGPVTETVRRAAQFQNFHLHLGVRDAVPVFDGRSIVIGDLAFDYVIAGTGYGVDLAARPELASVSDGIALWGDRYQPPKEERNEELARYPYLSPGFGLTAKGPDRRVEDIHLFNAAAMLSNGRNPAEVSGFRHGIPQLVSAIGADLYTADADMHVKRALTPVEPILSADEYRHSIWTERAPTFSRKDRAMQPARQDDAY